MPFELINAPAIFQTMARIIIKYMSFRKVYIENVFSGFRNINEHVGSILGVCERIWEDGLKVKLSKCEFYHGSD